MQKTREAMLKPIVADGERLQYDGEDEARIFKLADFMSHCTVNLISALGEFQAAASAPVDENSADAMKGARHRMIEAWAAQQIATSRIAYCLRVDSEECYKRAIEAAEKYEEPDFAGL